MLIKLSDQGDMKPSSLSLPVRSWDCLKYYRPEYTLSSRSSLPGSLLSLANIIMASLSETDRGVASLAPSLRHSLLAARMLETCWLLLRSTWVELLSLKHREAPREEMLE